MNRNFFLIALVVFSSYGIVAAQSQPNVLLIIADDLGIDALEGYGIEEGIFPHTPVINSLRENGISYMNNWATPICTPTRASIMSGKYGIKTGVRAVPGNLAVEDESLFNYLDRQTNDSYSTAVIGKWHLSDPINFNHPFEHGVDHFEGIIGGGVQNYNRWDKTDGGQLFEVREYVTTHFTNAAIDWISEQEKPWFLWLSHVAPHSPFQLPPAGLFTLDNPTTDRELYLATIEALDTEIGRLLDSMDAQTRANTLIIFMGDNGTPGGVLQAYPNRHGKGSMYEGGLRVPMVISGAGVTRRGEQEYGLTQANDLHATLIEACSNDLPGGIHNSYSIRSSFTTSDAVERNFVYADQSNNDVEFWAIRDQDYKLIQNENGNQEFYNLSESILEENQLIGNLSRQEREIRASLAAEAQVIRSGWSCQDFILNGEEQSIDDCATATHHLQESVVTIFPNPVSEQLQISLEGQLDYEVRLYSLSGQQVKFATNATLIELGDLPSGTYILELTDRQSQQKIIEKIVVGR